MIGDGDDDEEEENLNENEIIFKREQINNNNRESRSLYRARVVREWYLSIELFVQYWVHLNDENYGLTHALIAKTIQEVVV